MENSEKKSVLVPILLIIIAILVVLCVLFATDIISFKVKDIEESKPEIVEDNKHDENKILNPLVIELKKENESYNFDKLHFDFKGYSTDDGDEYYKYLLDIKLNEKEIDDTFFKDEDNFRIWSSNMAANFKVYKIENVYVLVSFIAKQCFYDEIMIINTNGEVLKTFTNASFDLDNNTNLLKISTSDDGMCMGKNYEKHVSNYTYSVKDDTIVLN